MALAYPTLPDPLPVHWDITGTPDRFEPKSWVSALSSTGLAPLLAALILGLCWHTARRRDPQLPDGDPVAARQGERARARAIQTSMAWISVATSAIFVGLSVAQAGKMSATAMNAIVWGALAATFVPIVWLVVHVARLEREAKTVGHVGPDSPDDDAHWPAGLVYYNTDDPRFMVPKRNGIGLTVNTGHPGGMAFMLATAMLLVVTLVAVVTQT